MRASGSPPPAPRGSPWHEERPWLHPPGTWGRGGQTWGAGRNKGRKRGTCRRRRAGPTGGDPFRGWSGFGARVCLLDSRLKSWIKKPHEVEGFGGRPDFFARALYGHNTGISRLCTQMCSFSQNDNAMPCRGLQCDALQGLAMRYISTKLVQHLGRRKPLAATLAKSGLSAAPMGVGGGPTGGRVAGAATCSPEDVTGLATNSPTREGED